LWHHDDDDTEQTAQCHPWTVGDYRKLAVWQKAHALAIETHRVSCGIRSTKYTSIRGELIRASAAIPANIVEGSGQKSGKEFSRYLSIAVNSATELEYHVLYACDIGVMLKSNADELSNQVEEVRRMLHGLMKRLDGD
jgi:four helix bundle protein